MGESSNDTTRDGREAMTVRKATLHTKGELDHEDRMARRRVAQGTGKLEDMTNAFYLYLGTGNTEELMRQTRAYVIKRLRSEMKVDAPENWLAVPEMESSVDPPGDGKVSMTTSDGDADDYTQRVMVYVLRKFPEFEGGAFEYRAWVQSVCDLRIRRAFGRRKKDSKFVPLAVEVTGEDGEVEEIDNPEIYDFSPYNNYPLTLPDWVADTDREIVNYMLDGLANKEIGELVCLSEGAIRQRFSRLLHKLEEHKAATKAARSERDAAERHRQEHKMRANRAYTAKFDTRLALMRDDEYTTAVEVVQPSAVG